ncbi:F-type H+-transporting ATPase subunit b [Catalinimonas alkaloidigena]|uniref:F0F1 ATP synthase subunit B n=1 Tax=Catalinimonas alkaloidigena TaxID=1075417 RepID=UPI002406A869|nr:F0F1 ATP synthase subunit B [Catalinimonas alkaloidigena]MDF9798307.1 F-type H+-transporting ATPase subunit b [Catalinimonas alkaloidigena]
MDLLTPDFGLIVWQILIFLVVLFVLSKFAWKPIINGLNERENSINESLLSAEKARNAMAELKADNEKLLAEARKERDNILKDATAAANKLREEAKEQASKDGARIIADAKASIETQKNAALAEVKDQVAQLSVQIAEKILREKLSDDKAQKEYISKLVNDLNVN